jgi:peptidyl-prolyl cis-trans isomerase SurA
MTARRRLAALAATALLSTVALAGCSSDDDPAPESTDAAAQAEPDLEDLPDVVAVVDDVDITKEQFVTAYEAQFQQLSAQAAQTGQPLDQDQAKQQTAESLVNTQLLVNEADARGYDVSQDDLDSTLAELAEQNGTSPEELLKSLADQGISKKEINRQLEGQVKLDRLVAEEGGDTKPTEAELRELYDQVKAQQQAAGSDTELPSFEDAKPQLVDQLTSQKESSLAQSLVEKLRKDADVTINL